MASLLDTKQRTLDSIERSEQALMKYKENLATLRETMKVLRTKHRVVLLSEYGYLKGREKEVLSAIGARKEQVQAERDGLVEIDQEIESTLVDINLISRQMAVLEFDRDRRRNQA